jgi:two-component system heavy metal sensor histidine kinase CusS
VKLTLRARLTLLYFLVLGGSFLVFFWICDFGFQRSIEATVNDASRRNLDTVQRVIAGAQAQGPIKIRKELSELSELWANGAIFEVAGADGQWLFRSPKFLLAQAPLPGASDASRVARFVTTNLDWEQYRVAQERVAIGGEVFVIDAAVPTEPFDQALDNFRLTEKRFLPLLVLLASLLGYWLSGRALAPVSRIIESAEKIGIQNLSQRLVVPGAKDELRRLTETVNAMLGRIESSVRRIQQFTADASHDLRTPLSLIRTNAELALRRPRSQVEYRQTLARILSTSEETTQLIEALLTLARADTGTVQLHFQLVNAIPVLHKAAQQGAFLAQSKGLTFTETLPEEPLYLRADPAALERLFSSLLDNALKYTPAGGKVDLRAFMASNCALIEVADTGIGISEADLPRIFDRFYRADQARSREVPGSGLGLAIAQWITDAHKGSIEANSRLGEGSTFRVRLPLAGDSSETEPAPSMNVESHAELSGNSVT